MSAATWAVMCLQLAGLKPPTLPALPGRRHECRDEALELPDHELAHIELRELRRLRAAWTREQCIDAIHAARERLQHKDMT
jgi:hypothetical protein